MAEVRRNLSEAFGAVAGFNEGIAVAKPEQAEKAESNRAPECGTGTDGIKEP